MNKEVKIRSDNASVQFTVAVPHTQTKEERMVLVLVIPDRTGAT